MDEEMGESNKPIRYEKFVKDYPVTPESDAGKSDILRRQGFLTSTETQEETAEALPRRLEHIVKEEGQFADDEQDKDYISHQRTAQIHSEESEGPQETDSSDSSTRKKSNVLEGIGLKYKDAKKTVKKMLRGERFKGADDELQNKPSKLFEIQKKEPLQAKTDIQQSETKKSFPEFQDLKDSMSAGSSNENADTKSYDMPLKRKSPKIFKTKEKYALQPQQNIELSQKKKFFTEFQGFTNSSSGELSSENSKTKLIKEPLKKKFSNIFKNKKKYVLKPEEDIEKSGEKKEVFTEFQDDSMPQGSSSEDTKQLSLPKIALKRISSKIFRKKEKCTLQPKQDIELAEAKKQFFTEFQDFTDSMSEKSSSENSDIKSVERPLKSRLSDIFRKENKYVLELKEEIKMSKEKVKKVIDSMSEESSNEKSKTIDIEMFNKKKNFPECWDLVDSMSEGSASEDSNSLLEMPSKGDSPEVFRKNEKYNLPTNKTIEISKEKKGNINELQNFTDSMSPGSNNANIKPETVMVEKKLKSPISFDKSQFPSATSAQLKDIEAKCLVKSSPAYTRPITSNAADVKSEKEVWEHFKQHLRSNKSYFDKTMVDSFNKEKRVTFPESENQVMKVSALIPKSGNELSHAIKKIDYDGKKRIVYDERREQIRNWILEQIKDKGVVLKSQLMEGKHSRDPETIWRCIANARNIQSQIDRLFDTLDDHDRSESIPKKSKGFWKCYSEKNIENPMAKSFAHSPSSHARRIKHSRNSYEYIDTYSKLFRYLCKPLSCRSENEKILKRINPRSFRAEYNKYWIDKEDTYCEGIKLKNGARSTVDNFCQSLKRLDSRVKSKIPLPDTGTLTDFQNHIIDLRVAVEENLDCLNTLLPLATAAVVSTMNYLSLSERKIIDIHVYLNERQPHLISRSEHEMFFDNFLQHHFKDSS